MELLQLAAVALLQLAPVPMLPGMVPLAPVAVLLAPVAVLLAPVAVLLVPVTVLLPGASSTSSAVRFEGRTLLSEHT